MSIVFANLSDGDKFAVISAGFVQGLTHFMPSKKAYLKCLKPGKCKCCEIKNTPKTRHVAWIWVYKDAKDPLQVFSHSSSKLADFFFKIASEKGLQAVDFVYHLKTSKDNKRQASVDSSGKLPDWYSKNADRVKALWLANKDTDLNEFMGKNLTYEEQVSFINDTPREFKNAPNPVGNFLSSPANSTGKAPSNTKVQSSSNVPSADKAQTAAQNTHKGVPDASEKKESVLGSLPSHHSFAGNIPDDIA